MRHRVNAPADYLFAVLFFSSAVSCSAEVSTTKTTFPSQLAGTWQVMHVQVDTEATRTLQYQYDDPRLTGRLFTLQAEGLSSNTRGATACKSPEVRSERTTAAALIRSTMSHRGLAPEVPVPQDYELPVPADSALDVIWVKCATGDLGPKGPPGPAGVNWILPLQNKQLLIRWFDDSVLVLERVAQAAKPSASFDCRKASSPTEKAICGSIALPGFDRSVATAYKDSIAQYKETSDTNSIQRLQAAQKSWLAKRDQCGADPACLQATMQDRLEALALGS